MFAEHSPPLNGPLNFKSSIHQHNGELIVFWHWPNKQSFGLCGIAAEWYNPQVVTYLGLRLTLRLSGLSSTRSIDRKNPQ